MSRSRPAYGTSMLGRCLLPSLGWNHEVSTDRHSATLKTLDEWQVSSMPNVPPHQRSAPFRRSVRILLDLPHTPSRNLSSMFSKSELQILRGTQTWRRTLVCSTLGLNARLHHRRCGSTKVNTLGHRVQSQPLLHRHGVSWWTSTVIVSMLRNQYPRSRGPQSLLSKGSLSRSLGMSGRRAVCQWLTRHLQRHATSQSTLEWHRHRRR